MHVVKRTRAGLFVVAFSLGATACGSTTSFSAPGGSVTSTGPAPAGWATEILEAHNRYRAAHCAPPLVWSPEIADIAQRWAERLAEGGGKLEHSQGDLGENLAGGTIGAIGATRSVDLWYAERPKYAGGFSMQSGHYSQVIWKGSQRLGCGTARAGDKEIWVCNYDPPGNVEGFYEENVAAAPCR